MRRPDGDDLKAWVTYANYLEELVMDLASTLAELRERVG